MKLSFAFTSALFAVCFLETEPLVEAITLDNSLEVGAELGSGDCTKINSKDTGRFSGDADTIEAARDACRAKTYTGSWAKTKQCLLINGKDDGGYWWKCEGADYEPKYAEHVLNKP